MAGAGRSDRQVLSQITENRKVEARKSLIFRHTIFTFGLKNANLRQNPLESNMSLCQMHMVELWIMLCLHRFPGLVLRLLEYG